MRFLTYALFAVLFLYVTSTAATLQRVRPLEEKIRSGHTLFSQHGCTNCHAVQGEGGKVGPDLSRMTVWASPILGAAVMWNHVPLMEKAMKKQDLFWPAFKENDLSDIFTYLHSLNKQKGSIFAFRGEAHIGKELYSTIGCQTCHGEPHRGGAIGPDLGKTAWRTTDENTFANRMLRHAPTMLKIAKKAGLLWPNLTGSEIANIFAYLQRLEQAK